MADRINTLLNILVQNGPITILLIVLMILIRSFLARLIMRNERLLAESRRRWLVTIRNSLLALFLIGLVLIWAPQLRTFTATLILVAAGVAIATKELITCLSGALLRMTTNAYGLGDRIEICGLRGNVVDHNLLTTTVLEVGPGQTSHKYTGRALIIPNSLLFSHPLTNETYTKMYVMHITRIPLTTKDDWAAAEKILLEAGREQCHSYLEQAKRYMKQLEGRHWLDAPSVDPRVTIQLKEAGQLDLLLRIPCPPYEIARMEQAIIRRFLAAYSGAPAESAPAPQHVDRN